MNEMYSAFIIISFIWPLIKDFTRIIIGKSLPGFSPGFYSLRGLMQERNVNYPVISKNLAKSLTFES